MILPQPSLTINHRRFGDEGWSDYVDDWPGFKRDMIDVAAEHRSDRPRRVLEVILEVAMGFAAVCATNRYLARRIGCSNCAIAAALDVLGQLGLIHCITDPRIPARRHIVLAKHPEAERILSELATCPHVVARNPWIKALANESPVESRLESDSVIDSHPGEWPATLPFVIPLGWPSPRWLWSRRKAR